MYQESDSADENSDESSSDDSSGEDTGAVAAQAPPAFALPTPDFGNSGAAAGIYHNPYEAKHKDIHSKRKMVDGERETIFKQITGKKGSYGQGGKPKQSSSVAKQWTSVRAAARSGPALARCLS